LGRSLGVDLVPFKTCTYDCVYCQLGRTTNKTIERREYVSIPDILGELGRKLASGDVPDYVAIAGSGEPTLHSGIGDLIEKVRVVTDLPVAVLTNGSLLWMRDVQDALMRADLVLPSIDAGDEKLFRYVNRPHTDIPFERMVDGIATFTRRFPGQVWLEVFLLGGVTGIRAEVEKIAAIASRIRPARVQLNTIARPPAEGFALPVSPTELLSLKSVFRERVEIISEIAHHGKVSSPTARASDADMLALLRRRPCTLQDIATGLFIHMTEALKHLDVLIAAGKVETVVIAGKGYYTATGPEVVRGRTR
jgi:wyosine [tRNA(Phe)-imidazoG37] synthetase (radical SAM superfamily)